MQSRQRRTLVVVLSLLLALALAEAVPLRPVFHVQPKANWTNDPNGPMYYKGVYHLFFQFNPTAAVWGDMHWGHVYSRDLVHWTHLPIALSPDQPYDKDGVFSGSAQVLDSGVPVIIYTGVQPQVQCLAWPKNASDPLLVEWVKDARNPIINAPAGRDPISPWRVTGSDDYFFGFGAQDNATKRGLIELYSTPDFESFSRVGVLYGDSPNTNFWECPDFYPLPAADPLGNVTASTYAVKASTNGRDFWTLGSYDATTHEFVRNAKVGDIGSADQLYDYGKFYASKRFYDPVQQRHVLFGWITEEDALSKQRGWAGMQSIPRQVQLDNTGTRLITYPLDDLQALRGAYVNVPGGTIPRGERIMKDVVGTQLELLVVFRVPNGQGELDFGLSVLQSPGGEEVTQIGLRGSASDVAHLQVYINRSRSSLEPSAAKSTYSGLAPPGVTTQARLRSEQPNSMLVELRVFVDGSVVEVFANGGTSAVSARVYPTRADSVHVGVFSYSSRGVDIVSFDAWTLKSIWKQKKTN